MQFIKNFYNHEEIIVGLTGIRKRKEYVKITIPETCKQTYLNFPQKNYLL